jgi:putative transposase
MQNAGRTVRAEVTDRMLIAGPRHLCAVLDAYAGRYNQHRPHRARDLRPPDGDMTTAEIGGLTTARIRRRRVLGGLINEYERAA